MATKAALPSTTLDSSLTDASEGLVRLAKSKELVRWHKKWMDGKNMDKVMDTMVR